MMDTTVHRGNCQGRHTRHLSILQMFQVTKLTSPVNSLRLRQQGAYPFFAQIERLTLAEKVKAHPFRFFSVYTYNTRSTYLTNFEPARTTKLFYQ